MHVRRGEGRKRRRCLVSPSSAISVGFSGGRWIPPEGPFHVTLQGPALQFAAFSGVLPLFKPAPLLGRSAGWGTYRTNLPQFPASTTAPAETSTKPQPDPKTQHHAPWGLVSPWSQVSNRFQQPLVLDRRSFFFMDALF